MPWCASASDQIRASAICPTAAAAWLSSSFSAPAGSPSTVRPSAMAPDETTSTSTPRACSSAISSASAASQAWLSRPVARSTRSAEPTLRTTRRNAVKARAHGCHSSCTSATGSAAARASSITPRSACSTSWTPSPRGRGHDEGRSLRGPLEARDLLLERLLVERIGLRERHDLGLVGEAVAVGLEFLADDLVGLARMFARALDEMEQDAAALDMAQEAVAEPGTLVRALDQARECRRARIRAIGARTTPRPGCRVVKG